MTRAASILAGILAATAAQAQEAVTASTRALNALSAATRPEREPADDPHRTAPSGPDRAPGLAAAPPVQARERG